MKIIQTDKAIIKSWCENPEEGAINQARNLANLSFLFKHVALMPDCHKGFGMPIGGVIACKAVVIPNAVGVDIGCGMLAIQTSLTELPTDSLKTIMSKIRDRVPVGFSHHNKPQMTEQQLFGGPFPIFDVISKEAHSATHQVGTLGGGNHFIEIQKGNDGHIWFMLHSGSRNLGKKVAEHYDAIAKEMNKIWHSNVQEESDLAFLPIYEQYGNAYLGEMRACLNFAQKNRDLMAQRIKESFIDVTQCDFGEAINIHHNYAALENHFGSNVVVHRKGATSAKKGELGIIPGSQGSASYIVRGRGNPDSFQSCSHGAGRKMGRREACKRLNLQEEQAAMEAKGIIHSVRSGRELDEAPGAYKDIDVVMAEQYDLVEILIKLEPLGCIKG